MRQRSSKTRISVSTGFGNLETSDNLHQINSSEMETLKDRSESSKNIKKRKKEVEIARALSQILTKKRKEYLHLVQQNHFI